MAEGERDACLVSGRRFLLTLTRLICFTLNSADWPVDSSLLFPDLDLVRDRDRAVSSVLYGYGRTAEIEVISAFCAVLFDCGGETAVPPFDFGSRARNFGILGLDGILIFLFSGQQWFLAPLEQLRHFSRHLLPLSLSCIL